MRIFLFLTAFTLVCSSGPVPADTASMAVGENGYAVPGPLFTVGETINNYTPPGVLDGLGAYALNKTTVRVLANHELRHHLGYPYKISDGNGGSFTLTGARISFFDIDRKTREVINSGIAYRTVYDANGHIASDLSFQPDFLQGFSRLCSGGLFESRQFGAGRGLHNRIYMAGEEDGGRFNPVGGAQWALDPETGNIWHLPAFGRGAWENVTELDTASRHKVAFLLADDTSPFDFDNDGAREAAPLYLYIGNKNRRGDFPARNGLRDGKLHVWVSDTGERTPTEFNGSGTLHGTWIEIDNSRSSTPSEDGSTGFDEYGYPTQGTLWIRAESLGAFGFSRPEDVATNPEDGSEAVIASTGVDTYENGIDTFGTTYLIKTDFSTLKADLTILYDGDADAEHTLRSPDNLDWADDGYIYVQEDEAGETATDGRPLFGPGAVNPGEAGIVRLDPVDLANSGDPLRVVSINRSVVLDASIMDPVQAVDVHAGKTGEWESSGIVDVSVLFGKEQGTLFLFDVQAHGIRDQDNFNPASRIIDTDLVEGGQLLFLTRDSKVNIKE